MAKDSPEPAGGRFGLGDLLAWASGREGLGGTGPRFSTVTMSSLPNGSPPMEPGGLFVAIRGAQRDGHDFAADAFANGARAALVARVPENLRTAVERGAVQVVDARAAAAPAPGPDALAGGPLLVLVDAPMDALQRCAAWWRRQKRARVLAVTGSVGKTTTKELLANVLDRGSTVLRTRGNLNNELGLPITLLQLAPEHDYAVLEIGISAVGEMATFAGVAQPDVAIVTRVAAAHLEGFGDVDTVEREKGMLVEALGAPGVAVLNADDPRVRRMATRTAAAALTFGLAEDAGVRATDLASRGLQGIAFRLHYLGRSETVETPLVGLHFVTCALAAAAAAFASGARWEDVVAGLGQRLEGQRVEPLTLESGVTVLDDSYNASPSAMQASLDVLAACTGRRVAVLGDMFEMGNAGPALHREVGTYVPGRADLLVAVGPLGKGIAEGAAEAGLDPGAVRWCPSVDDATAVLMHNLKAGDFVLVKGSRGMRMDRIVRVLSGENPDSARGGH